MTDQERTQLVETALKGIHVIQKSAEIALTSDSTAKGDSRRRAANVMLFTLMAAPSLEAVVKACKEIADKDETDLDTESPTPNA